MHSKKMGRPLLMAGMVAVGLLALAGSAMGSGFALIEQSASGAGHAYAGMAAAGLDASTIFFNPAGMARLSGQELQIGAHYVIPQAEFTNQGSTTALGTPLTGGNGGDGGEPGLVPNLYYRYSLSDRWKFGIGITAPFGLATDYDDGWVGRYHALNSELTTIDINPAVAYRINDQWSVGVGVSFQYAEAKLSNAIDWGTALVARGLAPPSASQNIDGSVDVEGDDWGVGANVGLIFEPRLGTRLGLHYRSKVDHTLEGDADFDTPAAAAAFAQAARLVDTTAKAEVSLPETVSFSAYHEIGQHWAILADVTWTKWSQLDELRIQFGTGAADSVVTLDWDDTWRYSLGAIFRPTDPLELRAGLAFDETPITSDRNRTPRIPDADRTWITLGAGYQFTPLIRADFAYAHLFVDDPRIDKTATGEDQLRGALVGEYDASVDIISASVSFQF